jgi:hypothetical protein
VLDGAQTEAAAFAEQALCVPAGEVHTAENRGASSTRDIFDAEVRQGIHRVCRSECPSQRVT